MANKNLKFLFSVLGCFFALILLTSCATQKYGKAKKTAPAPTKPVVLQQSSYSYKPAPVYKEELYPIYSEKDFDVYGKEKLKIGMLLPLSGSAASAGIAMQNAARLAMSEIAPSDLLLRFYNTEGTEEGAERAAEEAADQDVDLILGPLFSHSVAAVTPIAKRYDIPVVSFSTDPNILDKDIFSLGFLVHQQVERILTYATEQNYYRLALLAPDNTAGREIISAASNFSKILGIQMDHIAFYTPGNNKDMGRAIQEVSSYETRKHNLQKAIRATSSATEKKRLEKLDTLGDVDFDAILLADSDSSLRTVISMLPYYDVSPNKIKFLGTSLWDNKKILNEHAAEGAWFVGPETKGINRFIQSYKNNFTSTPPQIAALAYDAIALATMLSKQNYLDDEDITNPNGFIGVNGMFRLLPNGASEHSLAVFEIGKGGSKRVIDSAPQTFEQPLFNEYDLGSYGNYRFDVRPAVEVQPLKY